ncbi:MAG: hypothetical protein ACK4QW_19250, partial [Alphaproteobacteria bacterium]
MPPLDQLRERRGVPAATRRRLPIVGAILVLAAFGGAIWYAYTMGRSAMVDAEIPLIKARTDPMRAPPDDRGGLLVPFRDKLVYEQLLSDTPPSPSAEARLLPPPEEPVERPPPMPAEPEPAASAALEGVTTGLPFEAGTEPRDERTPALPPEAGAPQDGVTEDGVPAVLPTIPTPRPAPPSAPPAAAAGA